MRGGHGKSRDGLLAIGRLHESDSGRLDTSRRISSTTASLSRGMNGLTPRAGTSGQGQENPRNRKC